MAREQLNTVNAFILDVIDHSMAREIDEHITGSERFKRRQISIGMKQFLGKVTARLEAKKYVRIRVRRLHEGSRYFTIGRARQVCYFVPKESFEHNFPKDPDSRLIPPA
jgi:hypothetical protein